MSRRLLGAPWPLRDVDDVEDLARGVVLELTRRYPMPISDADFDATVAHLLGEAVILERRFDRLRREKPWLQFRPWLYIRLGGRAIDFWRSSEMYGRRGQHRHASLDELRDRDREPDELGALTLGPGGGAFPDEAPVVGRSRGAPADPADDWLAALTGLHAGGDRAPAGRDGGVDLGEGAAAPHDAARLGARAAGRSAGAEGAAAGAAFADCAACGWRSYAQAPNGVDRWHLPEACQGCGSPLAVRELELAAA